MGIKNQDCRHMCSSYGSNIAEFRVTFKPNENITEDVPLVRYCPFCGKELSEDDCHGGSDHISMNT